MCRNLKQTHPNPPLSRRGLFPPDKGDKGGLLDNTKKTDLKCDQFFCLK